MNSIYRYTQFFLGLLFLISGCDLHFEDETNHHGTNQLHWSCQGETSPEHWDEIENNSECGGERQSPINIIDFKAIKSSSPIQLELYYSSETHLKKAANNGHTVQFEFMPGDSILYNGEIYHLVQVHFHEHAEHLICGVVYPVEIHLVHVSAEGGLTVLAILGKEGQESQIIELLESFLPLKMGETKNINAKCDLNQVLPTDKTFYSYSGSLTTPPCTEDVNWVVFKEPIILSLEEVEKLKINMPLNNYRFEQPLNGRVVYQNAEKTH